jgi:hypothetical protein
MPEFFEYSPHNGVQELWDYDQQTGKAWIRHNGDHEAFFSRNAESRNTRACDKGIMENGKEFHWYCSIPPVVQIELRTKGIDIYSKDPVMIRRMFDEINQNYPLLKMTDKKHR